MNAHSLLHLASGWPRLLPAPASRGRVPTRAETEAIRLRRHQVLTIADAALASRIQVQQGAVWLTGTPGEKDVVLQAQESLGLTNHYPFVLEALTEAEIILTR